MSDADKWRQLVGEAILERDPVKLRPMVDAAQAALIERLRELKDRDDCAVEQDDIHGGIRILRRLQVERLHYPERSAL